MMYDLDEKGSGFVYNVLRILTFCPNTYDSVVNG